MSEFLNQLRKANQLRLIEWTNNRPEIMSALFKATELGGEVGEAMNVVKKMYRAEHGMVTSSASVEDLAEELADVLICVDLLAANFNIDLKSSTIAKFNKTSCKYKLKTKLKTK